MCGIAGVLSDEYARSGPNLIAALKHRGPDSLGIAELPGVFLGATRLAIVDPSAGPQPLLNGSGSIAVAFNGEIYNHHELRKELVSMGYAFTSGTDTEVVLHAYEAFGVGCFSRFRGMFSIALAEPKRLILARDRTGIKPLYFAFSESDCSLIFASEIKSILQWPSMPVRLSKVGLADWFSLGYPSGNATLFDNIQSLTPGCYREFSLDGSLDRRVDLGKDIEYDQADTGEGSNGPKCQGLLDILGDAVESHLTADVAACLTLSGGLDSTLLALLAVERGLRPDAFSVMETPTHPDAVAARLIASELGLRIQECHFGFEEYLSSIPGYILAQETPCSLSAIPFFILAKNIAKDFKVCISGEGADELFGGYPEYLNPKASSLGFYKRSVPELYKVGLVPSASAAASMSALDSAEDYLAEIFNFNMGSQLEKFHLNPLDRISMHFGLEARVPFLYDPVVTFARGLEPKELVSRTFGVRKFLLRRCVMERFGMKAFNAVVREKRGLPSSGMVSDGKFQKFCDEELPDDYSSRHEYGALFKSKADLLIFELFEHLFLENRGVLPRGIDIRDFIATQARLNVRQRSYHAQSS